MPENSTLKPASKRLLSIDFYRGLTMFLLIGSGTTLFKLMRASDVGFVAWLGNEFEHAPWEHGLTFWDVVEPFFMFIVGVAIPLSTMKRLERGDPWKKVFKHVFQRAAILFFLGMAIYSVWAGKPVFHLWNVLTQLGIIYLVGFLLMRKKIQTQVIVSLALLLATYLLYRFFPVEGFNQPYVPDHNFGSWFDLTIMGVMNKDHWVAFNFMPTAAITIWGVITGLILQGEKSDKQKINIFLAAGIAGLVLGFGLNFFIPIIKRIGTPSSILATGGICFLFLAISYWAIEVKKFEKVPKFFAIVGMNPLFIYLFNQLDGTKVLYRIAHPFTYGLFFWIGKDGLAYITAIVTWGLLWYVCYWLYKHKILIKI